MSGSLPVLGLVAAFLIGPLVEPTDSPKGEGPVQIVLERYEQAMCPLKSFETDFTRIVYDGVWKVEYHSSGRVYFDAAGNARIELIPDKVEANQRGARYHIKPVSYAKWIFKSGFVFQFTKFDDVYKFADSHPQWPYKSVEYPRGRMPWHSVVPPILLGMTASELQRKFRIQFVKHSAGGQILSFVPLDTKRRINLERMDVIFDDVSGLPMATKMYDKGLKREEVVVFDRATLKVNQPLQPGEDPLELEPNEFERLLREQIATPIP